MTQRTFSIIKPDAVRKGYTAAILAQIEKAGFKIVSVKRLSISKAQAEEGTIRKKFASSIGENAIHGSDAEDTAAFEIGYFFAGIELQ